MIQFISKIYNETIESLCTRVLYFFNTIDTYFLFAGILSFVIVSPKDINPLVFIVVMFYVFITSKISDFYPYFPIVGVVIMIILIPLLHLELVMVGLLLFVNVIVFILTQFFFMGLPDSIVARDLKVPFLKLLNSLLTVAPTTVSFSMSVFFSFYLSFCLLVSVDIDSTNSAPIIAACLLLIGAAFFTRWCRPKNSFSKFFKPDILSRPLFNRVLVLNIDGVRKDIFDNLNLPTISWLKKNGTFHESGLKTVYRALTNPAFASIFTGTAPEVHGVRDNNFGQSIKTEGLPDIVPTIAYGSMHVKHFCKKYWETKIVSLPRHSVYKSDEIALEWMKQDILERDNVRLFVFDFSEADFLAHAYGSTSKNYKQALIRTDQRIGHFLNWLRENNGFDDTAVIVCSDHGIAGIDHSYLLAQSERYVPFLLYGKGIKKDFPLRRPGSIMDICNTIAYLLGIRYPYDSRGQVFLEALEDGNVHEKQEELVRRFNRLKYGLEAQHYRAFHAEIYQGDVTWWKSTLAATLTLKGEGLRVLDIGSGTGFVAEQFLAAGLPIKTFVCQDVSFEMLDHARETIGTQPGFEFVTSLDDVEGQFDIITASSVFHHLAEIKAMTNRIDSLLVEGGLVIGAHEPNRAAFQNRFFTAAASFYKAIGGGVSISQEFVREFNAVLKKQYPTAPPVCREEILQMVEFHSPLEQYDKGVDPSVGFDPRSFFREYFSEYRIIKIETYTSFFHRPWLEEHQTIQSVLALFYRTFFRHGNLFRFVIQKSQNTRI